MSEGGGARGTAAKGIEQVILPQFPSASERSPEDDVHHRSRKSLLKRFEEEFGKDGAVQQEITEVDRKILSPRIVVETGVWKNTGSTDKTRADRGRYSCILVKKKGKWLIVQDRGWAQPAKK